MPGTQNHKPLAEKEDSGARFKKYAPLLISLSILALLCAKALRDGPTFDYKIYWTAGEQASHSESLYGGEPSDLKFFYAPVFAVAFEALQPLTLEVSFVLWIVLSAVCLLFSALIIERALGERKKLDFLPKISWFVALSLLLALYPLLSNFRHGNSNCFLLLFLSLAFWGCSRNRPSVTGISLALATVMKVTPILFIPWLLFRQKVQDCIWFVGGLALLLIIVPLSTKGQDWTLNESRSWWNTVLAPVANPGAESDSPEILRYSGSSLPQVAIALLGDRTLIEEPEEFEFTPLLSFSPITAKRIGTICGCLLLAAAMFLFRSRKVPTQLLSFSLLLAALLLASPVSRSAHFSILLPLIMVVLDAARSTGNVGQRLSRWGTGLTISMPLVLVILAEVIGYSSKTFYPMTGMTIVLMATGLMLASKYKRNEAQNLNSAEETSGPSGPEPLARAEDGPVEPADQPPIERRKRILFRLGAVFGSILVTIILLETIGGIGLQLRPSTADAAPKELRDSLLLTNRSVATDPHPYLLYQMRRNLDTENATTNDLGLRNDPIATKKPDDVFRILLLGGSVTWGYTSKDNTDTLASYLQTYLEENMKASSAFHGKTTIEVLNAGVPGYVLWQSALSYALSWREIEPDAIVSIEGYNDVYSAVLTGYAGVPKRYDPEGKTYSDAHRSLFGSLSKWASYRIGKMRIVRFIREMTPPGIEDLHPPDPNLVANEYARAMNFLGDMARLENATVYSVLQPVLSLPGAKKRTGFESSLLDIQERRIPSMSGYLEKCYALLARQGQRCADEHPQIHFIDTSRAFQEQEETMFADICHLTIDARKMIAHEIGKQILESQD